jgi:hypothetical protein
MTLDIDTFMAKGAGVIGSLVSLGHVKGTWSEKLAMFVTGAASSYYASPLIADKLGMPEGACGFMAGLFGMSIVSKAYEYIQAADLSSFLPAFFKRKE